MAVGQPGIDQVRRGEGRRGDRRARSSESASRRPHRRPFGLAALLNEPLSSSTPGGTSQEIALRSRRAWKIPRPRPATSFGRLGTCHPVGMANAMNLALHPYRVRLPHFDGPLDVLVELVRRGELSPLDLALSDVVIGYL